MVMNAQSVCYTDTLSDAIELCVNYMISSGIFII